MNEVDCPRCGGTGGRCSCLEDPDYMFPLAHGHHEYCDTQDQIIKGKPCNCAHGCSGCEQSEALISELVECLHELVLRCDGEQGVRPDGSNIDTVYAHAVLDKWLAKWETK